MIPPTNLPWPPIKYGNAPEGYGQNPSDYSEWWDIPGVARFDSEADAMFVHDLAANFDEIVSLLQDARKKPDLAGRADAVLRSIRAVEGGGRYEG